jgi:glutaredoxin
MGKRILSIGAVLLLVIVSVGAVQSYQSTAEVQTPTAPAVQANTDKQVIMYATSWCGYCKQARQYFTRNNIPFVEYDVEEDPQARREYDELGGDGVPIILVGKYWLDGFDQEEFEAVYKDQN